MLFQFELPYLRFVYANEAIEVYVDVVANVEFANFVLLLNGSLTSGAILLCKLEARVDKTEPPNGSQDFT